MTQKERHFKYFELLNTLPVNCQVETTNGNEQEEHVLEMQAEGAAQQVISWNDWWQLKSETNKQLLDAIRQKDAHTVSDLLDETKQAHGLTADVNMRFDEDETPLHSAVLTGDIEIVQILLNMFAELNSQDLDGKTPLHYSCMVGNVSMTQLLTQR